MTTREVASRSSPTTTGSVRLTPPSISVGIYPKAPVRDIMQLARMLDGTRVDTLWIADSHLLWRECWSSIAACAAITDSLRLGSGVSNPLSRHPSVLAAEVATLQELSRGRIRLGMGVGDSALRMMLGRVARLADLRTAIDAIRDLLKTGKTTFEGRDLTMALTCPGTEIWISGSGPKTLAQAGELGDGAIIVPGFDARRIAQTNAAVDSGAALRPRKAHSVRRLLWIACSIRRSTDQAVEDVRPFVTSLLRHPTVYDLTPDLERFRESLQKSYDFSHHMAERAPHAESLSKEVAAEFAVAGTSAQVGETIGGLVSLRSSRIDEVALVLMGPDMIDQGRELLRVIEADP